ncbi:hypothetical protein CEP52_017614 [Fusarium oligoseptatum]|uniref:Uncharacterized protein n=1 Tax=Fusarium oligoseptatum TaxID=2604345 RepID=A0A428RM95_9HYPO|nr:hypothetical protein CEP52_017614 [Fusarium oligoseptatum]
MYILLGPLAVTLGTISYYIWLLYLTSRLPKYSHSPQHGHSPKQSQLVKLGQLSDASATFFQKHPRRFMSLAFAFVVLGICVMTAWAVLTFIQGGHWAIAFWYHAGSLEYVERTGCVLQISPMGAFCTASGLILGAILSIRFAKGIFFIVLSAGAYRAWLTWEWGKV